MDICLWVVGCKKPNPRMNSCMESRVRVWILTLSMESNIEYGLLGFLVWIHVCGLWVVRNLTLE